MGDWAAPFRRFRSWQWLVLPSVLVTGLLWLPFGFQLIGLIEEWGCVQLFDVQHAVFFLTWNSSSIHRMRALTFFPQAVAYALDPDSFFFWHVILIVILIVKGACASALAWFMTRSRWIAALAGVLLLLYPADTMQLCFRSLHINGALALILLAAVCHLRACEITPCAKRILMEGLAVFLLASAALMYETALFLAPLPFLALFVREGVKDGVRLIRLHWGLSLAWVGGATGTLAYMLYIVTHGPLTYQTALGGALPEVGINLLDRFHFLFSIGMMRALIGGWFDAGGILLLEFRHYEYPLAMAAFLFAAIWFFGRDLLFRGGGTLLSGRGDGWGVPIRLAMAGALLAPLGYLPYLVSMSHVMLTQRAYLFASVGASFICLAMVIALFRISRIAAAAVVALMLVAGSAMQLYEFHYYIEIGKRQQAVLKAIDEAIGSVPAGHEILLIDESATFNSVWTQNVTIAETIDYFLHLSLPVHLVLEPGSHWQVSDSLGRMGECVETPSSWIFRPKKPVGGAGLLSVPVAAPLEIAKDRILVVRIDRNGRVDLPAAIESEADDSHRLRRYRNILSPTPWPLDFKMFREADLSGCHFDFGRWWNLDSMFRGTGFHEGEWTTAPFFHTPSAWINEPVATVLFDLHPAPHSYVLEGRFTAFISQGLNQSMHIGINGHPIACAWRHGGLRFRGEVDPAWLVDGLNEVEFSCPTDGKSSGLSAKLQSFDLQPQPMSGE